MNPNAKRIKKKHETMFTIIQPTREKEITCEREIRMLI